MTADRRAHFDFTIAFANGGGMQGDGFRLDLPREDVSAQEIGALLIRHLGLALVRTVELHDLRIVEEPHRGSRGVDAVGDAVEDRVIDLSHPIEAGLVTYPGLPAPIITPYLTREDSRARYAPGTEFEMDVITMIGNTGTYLDAPFHRYADGGDLASLELRTLVGLPAEVFHLRDAWAPERRGIQATTLADRELHGAAVLLDTGWDRYFGRPEYASGAPSSPRTPPVSWSMPEYVSSASTRSTSTTPRVEGSVRRTASCSPEGCMWSSIWRISTRFRPAERGSLRRRRRYEGSARSRFEPSPPCRRLTDHMGHTGLHASQLPHRVCTSRKGYVGCPRFQTSDSSPLLRLQS
jgi:kynurenine formamidase